MCRYSFVHSCNEAFALIHHVSMHRSMNKGFFFFSFFLLILIVEGDTAGWVGGSAGLNSDSSCCSGCCSA